MDQEFNARLESHFAKMMHEKNDWLTGAEFRDCLRYAFLEGAQFMSDEAARMVRAEFEATP